MCVQQEILSEGGRNEYATATTSSTKKKNDRRTEVILRAIKVGRGSRILISLF